MKLTVIIPTYRRPVDLARCFSGLAQQQRPADEVIVVVRGEDTSTPPIIAEWANQLPIKCRTVSVPGVVQALNVGLDHTTGDIMTVTDDDSLASPDWLLRIERYFSENPHLGGLGGRDLIHERGRILYPTTDRVGLILPYGRIIGNHHLGYGPPRAVDHLKGVNMSWRMAAVDGRRFETGLRGMGAQVYFELAFSLEISSRGWQILYDPELVVEHFLAQRFDHDVRGAPDVKADENASYNLCLALRRYMKPGTKKSITLLWVHYIGAFGHPGRLRGFWFRLTGNQRGVTLSDAVARAWKDAKQETKAPVAGTL